MKNILLATNLGQRSQQALERALLIARAHNATLHVIHVASRSDMEAEDVLTQQIHTAIQHLETELEDAFGAGFAPASLKSVVGDPAEAIALEAKSTDADLVIAGLSERTEPKGRIDGTILEHLLMSASRPLIVVQSHPTRHYEKVLVGLDLTSTARHALESALQVAPTADFVIVHALEVGDPHDLREDINAVVKDCFSVARDAVGMHEGSVEIRIEKGSVPDVLARHTQRTKPDLVTFGRHNRGPSAEPYLGSGARGILENLKADMLVTPPWD